MKQANEFWIDSLHVFVLFAFAIAQPLLDLLSRNAEFFVARHAQPINIVLLVVILCMLLPAVVVFVEGLVGWCCQQARARGHSLVVICLVAAIALQALKRIGDLPSAFLMTGAGFLGIAAALRYAAGASWAVGEVPLASRSARRSRQLRVPITVPYSVVVLLFPQLRNFYR